MGVEDRRQAWNARARARLLASADVLPAPVLGHALAARWTPRTLRAAVDLYWRAHPIRADRLARSLARASGAPAGWEWRLGEGAASGFRQPPLPWREVDSAGGRCVVCGQPVFRLGWHRPRGAAEKPGRAAWHACCVVAWKFWTAPGDHRKLLSRLQGRRCAISDTRLLKTAEVDHRTPLFRVRRDHRDTPWPELLAYWGLPNLQVVNRGAHAEKSIAETRLRSELRQGRALSAETASLP
jgi:hypothetical protein